MHLMFSGRKSIVANNDVRTERKQPSGKMKQRNSYIEFVRFVCAILVALYHWKGGHFSGSYLVVEFFFILSGFFLMRHAERIREQSGDMSMERCAQNSITYLKGRLKVLYPHFIFSFFVLFFIKVFVLQSVSLYHVAVNSFWEILFLQNIGLTLAGNLLNPATWFLSSLLIMGYLIYFLLQRYRTAFLYLIAPFSVICGFCYLYMLNGDLSSVSTILGFTTIGMIKGFVGLSLGCLCYLMYRWFDLHLRKNSLLVCVFQTVIEFGIELVLLWGCYENGFSRKDFIFTVLFAVLLIMINLENSLISRLFRWKCWRREITTIFCREYLTNFCRRTPEPVE